jgi:hypothetical protein
MWYLAEILFAQPREPGRTAYQCEACNVLFQASTAEEAYQKAVRWGRAYAGQEPAAFEFMGVARLSTVGEEVGDGVEICGRFFEEPDVWDRVDRLIPPPSLLEAVRWEQCKNTPLQDVLSPEQVSQLKKTFGRDA